MAHVYRLKVIDQPAFPWESQRDQYPATASPGIHYYAGQTAWGTVDCLLYYDALGILRGALNHYPFTNEWEQEGNVNIFIDPAFRRRGVATALLNEARERWVFDVEQQTYTREGADFIQSYLWRLG